MSDRWIPPAETAKLIRKALKRDHPGVKFSVRTRTYSGGASVDVTWTDGPAVPEVDATVKPYGGKGFDGSIDMEYHWSAWLEPDGSVVLAESSGTTGSRGAVPSYLGAPPSEDAELVSFGAGYISTHRNLSDGFVSRAMDAAEHGTSGGLTCACCYGGIASGEPILLADGRCYHDSRECFRHAGTYHLSESALREAEEWRDLVELLNA